jgi:alkyl sulfatase BDS1-like metallo-beta-lactamase superfamily hydrolase
VNHLVFADPSNPEARSLQADVLEQLGYQAESSTFRNAYLMGAQELREGPPTPTNVNVRGRNLVREMTVEQVFDALAIRAKSEDLGGIAVSVNWVFTDLPESGDGRWCLEVSNRTLHATRGRLRDGAGCTVTTTRPAFLEIVSQSTTFMDALAAGDVALEGDAAALLAVFGNLDTFMAGFPIVEP